MTELLHGTGVRLGLVTNGERWMLVDAPKGETSGYASWYATLWLEEPITVRAFRSLLGLHRFFGVNEKETLEELLKKSAANQQEVIRLKFQDDLSYREISRITTLSVSNVGFLIHTGIKTLRQRVRALEGASHED